MFRAMDKLPVFDLISVGFGSPDNPKQLWRKYTLSIPHFECEILEVFPDRQMFVDPDRWLSGLPSPVLYNIDTALYQALRPVLVGALLLMASFEIWRFIWGRTPC